MSRRNWLIYYWVARSAVTGRFVPMAYARRYPNRTVKERRWRPAGRRIRHR